LSASPSPPGYSPNEVADRLAIQDLLTRYAVAIDTKDWTLLDTVFTPDATLDYESSGGPRAPYPDARAWLARVLEPMVMTQHILGNVTIELDGDSARSRAYYYNPMGAGAPDEEDGMLLFFNGGYYTDRLTRTAAGWRITERVEEMAWIQGWPRPKPGEYL